MHKWLGCCTPNPIRPFMIIVIYIFAIVLANFLVAALGPWFSPINAFLLIGLDLTLRDRIHDKWQGAQLWPKMLLMIISAGIISYLINPSIGRIATASVAAFCIASFADALVYQLLRKRPWMARANGSNIAGAAADSLIFPLIAFGAFMPEITLLQFFAKVAGGALWALVLQHLIKERLETAK